MEKYQKWISIFTSCLIGSGFGSVISGKPFNNYLLSIILFLIVINLAVVNANKK